jgi:hypothetical protein
MERIIWNHLSQQPFYVFDRKHIVHFWDDGVSVHRAAKSYQEVDTWLSPFDGPHVYSKALPLEFYKRIVLDDRFPISLDLAGEELGTVKLTADYGHGSVESGANRRRIIRQQTKLWLAADSVGFSLKIEATAVDPKTAHGTLRKVDKMPQSFAFKFAFPFDIVPELLNLTDSERRVVQRNRARAL